MTPKEKAQELFNKIYEIDTYDAYCNECALGYDQIKDIALIAIDEIIEAIRYLDNDSEDYWNEVKKEIEKL